MTKRMQSVSIASVLLVAAVSCGGSSPPAASPTSTPPVAQAAPSDVGKVGVGEEEDESTADLAEHHRHHHHGGFAMFIAMSLDSLGISDDQHDAITKIQADMHAKLQPAHDAEKALLLALADGVEAGNVDRAKLAAAISQVASASAGVHDAVADSLNALHQTLTVSQRRALVDKVEAHFEVWHHTNAPDDAGANDTHRGHLGQLAASLELAPDQVDKIRASYHDALAAAPRFDRAEADAHFKAFATAFTSSTFDARSLTTAASVNGHMATWGVTRLVLLYSAAAPILTPDQRARAANELRRHANYRRTDSEP